MRITLSSDEATIIIQNYIALRYKISASDVFQTVDDKGNMVYCFKLPLDCDDGERGHDEVA